MRITQSLPSTGYQRPSADELRALLKIARAAHPWIPDRIESEFARAFFQPSVFSFV